MTYIVSTTDVSSRLVQFSGQESWIWYSHDPLVAVQKAKFGSTFVGHEVAMGLNCHALLRFIVVSIVFMCLCGILWCNAGTTAPTDYAPGGLSKPFCTCASRQDFIPPMSACSIRP